MMVLLLEHHRRHMNTARRRASTLFAVSPIRLASPKQAFLLPLRTIREQRSTHTRNTRFTRRIRYDTARIYAHTATTRCTTLIYAYLYTTV